ncbi:zf-HC2 domain-containing protein [Thermodesulfobacteriota bacterium]
MKCSKAQRFINDHVDNLLEIKEIRSLKSHIQECTDCRDLLIDMGTIADNAKELETIQPSRDLWPEIKKQVIKKDRKARIGRNSFFGNFPLYSGGWSFALSTLLVIIILIPLVYYGFPYIDNLDNHQERIALNHLKIAEEHYQSAIEALDRAIESRDVELSPELAAVFKKNLEIIDDSIRICKAAVDRHPENPEANKLLLICYRKKMELLNEINDLAMQIG